MLDANAYLDSLGIDIVDAAKPAVGRLALAGEFALEGKRGVVVRPKRGGVSDRYLELLAAEGYDYVVVDGGSYPGFYELEGESLVPIRALPVRSPERFPSTTALEAWGRLIRAAVGRGDAAKLGADQMVARLRHDEHFGPQLVRTSDKTALARLGASEATDEEPARTAGALLSGYACSPSTADDFVGVVGAITSLHDHRGELSGLARSLGRLLDLGHLGQARLIVSSGAGAELGAVFGHEGALVLPAALERLRPLFEQVLPTVELAFEDFLQKRTGAAFDGVVVVPPLGLRLNGRNVAGFELSKKSGKALSKVSAETLYVEHALAATSETGLLIAVLPEGLLSSAGHAHFREWLLERARLLAVMSLPAGSCFDSTGVKCSVVILRKQAPADDYPILMIDVEDGDLDAELASARLTLDEFLNREVAACA